MIRFLFLTTPRSGSTMLRLFLTDHPSVEMHVLFVRPPRAKMNEVSTYKAWLDFQSSGPSLGKTHLGTFTFREDYDWIKRCYTGTGEFWSDMRERHDYYVCLHRENLLKQYLSNRIGNYPGGRKQDKPRTQQPVPITLLTPHFLAYVSTHQSLRKKIDSNFPDRLIVTYEQLTDEWQLVTRRIQKYLGLPIVEVPPRTFRQETRTLKEAIANYDDVARCVEKINRTEWLE